MCEKSKTLIVSRDTYSQRILQSDWTRLHFGLLQFGTLSIKLRKKQFGFLKN